MAKTPKAKELGTKTPGTKVRTPRTSGATVPAPKAPRGRSLGVTRSGKPANRASGRARLTMRVDFGAHGSLGPGKIALLEHIDRHGSITAAGKSMAMSYRRAWLLVDDINAMFERPAVVKQHGGAGGGNAVLTPFGQKLVADYRQMEREATAAVSRRLQAFLRALGGTPP